MISMFFSVNDNDRIPGSGYKNQHIIGLKMEKSATLKDMYVRSFQKNLNNYYSLGDLTT